MKSFYLNRDQYIYHPETNQLINQQIKSIYSKYAKEETITFLQAKVDKPTITEKLKHLRQLVIETGQNCNLDCKYCVYSSGEYFYTRDSSSRCIDFDTARKAIDYAFGLISDRDKKEFTIGFYGGEPLLYVDLIQQIVDYAKSIFKNWRLIFTITTNGTILPDSIIKLLMDNNFKTLVSLDGPKESHDQKRVFPDGTGSHNVVMENLKRLRAANEQYYIDMVTFSIVYSKDLSLEKLYHFFNTSGLVKYNTSNLGFVNEYDTQYYDKYKYDKKRLREEGKRIFRAILKRNSTEDLSNIDTSFIMVHSILNDTLKARKFSLLTGTCCYDDRLMVAADGKYHICEKMNDKFPIGNTEDGFDYERMVDLVKEYSDLINECCRDCEIRFLCVRCFANLAGNGKFEMNKKFCEDNVFSTKKMLEEVIQLNEGGLLP